MRTRFQTKKNGCSYVLAAVAKMEKVWTDKVRIERKPLFNFA